MHFVVVKEFAASITVLSEALEITAPPVAWLAGPDRPDRVISADQSATRPHCRFTPTCSQYGIEALRRFGVIKAVAFTMKRVSNATLYTLVVTIPSRLDHLIPENTNDRFTIESLIIALLSCLHDWQAWRRAKIRSPAADHATTTTAAGSAADQHRPVAQGS